MKFWNVCQTSIFGTQEISESFFLNKKSPSPHTCDSIKLTSFLGHSKIEFVTRRISRCMRVSNATGRTSCHQPRSPPIVTWPRVLGTQAPAAEWGSVNISLKTKLIYDSQNQPAMSRDTCSDRWNLFVGLHILSLRTPVACPSAIVLFAFLQSPAISDHLGIWSAYRIHTL